MTKTLIVTMLLFLSAAATVAANAAPAHETDEQAVRQVVTDFAAGLRQGDAAALDRLLSPDYTFVTPAGAVQTKDQRLAPIRSGDLKYSSVEYDEVKARLYGDAAVVTSRVTVQGHNKETDVSGRFRSTLTLVRRDGRWQIVSAQANALQE